MQLGFWTGGPVYHYTDSAGLIGIVRSNCLWASALLGLNDPTELTYGVERLHEEVENWQPGLLRDLLLELLKSGTITEIKDATFVVCGSSNGEALSQWRSYAGGRGYAVGIDPAPMLGVVGPDGPQLDGAFPPKWYRVAYDEDSQRSAIQKALQFLEEGDLEQSAIHARFIIGVLVSLLKPSEFRDEQEVRLVVRATTGPGQQFRPGRFGVLPYVEVARFTPPPAEIDSEPIPTKPQRGSLPLVSITCGPGDTDEQEFAVAAATRLARTYGYSIDVGRSRIRFRF